jgi:hypothetical protein
VAQYTKCLRTLKLPSLEHREQLRCGILSHLSLAMNGSAGSLPGKRKRLGIYASKKGSQNLVVECVDLAVGWAALIAKVV